MHLITIVTAAAICNAKVALLINFLWNLVKHIQLKIVLKKKGRVTWKSQQNSFWLNIFGLKFFSSYILQWVHVFCIHDCQSLWYQFFSLIFHARASSFLAYRLSAVCFGAAVVGRHPGMGAYVLISILDFKKWSAICHTCSGELISLLYMSCNIKEIEFFNCMETIWALNIFFNNIFLFIKLKQLNQYALSAQN